MKIQLFTKYDASSCTQNEFPAKNISNFTPMKLRKFIAFVEYTNHITIIFDLLYCVKDEKKKCWSLPLQAFIK